VIESFDTKPPVDLCEHGEEKLPGACSECAEEYAQMRRDDERNYQNRG
jgi:hypothetical protein